MITARLQIAPLLEPVAVDGDAADAADAAYGRPLSAYTELTSDWLWETDVELNYGWVSDKVGRFGTVKEALLGVSHIAVVSAGAGPAALQAHLDDLAVRRPFDRFVFRLLTGDGVERWVSASGRPFHDANGAFRGYRGSGRDITRLRDSQRYAHAAQNRLFEAIESALEAYALYDADGVLLACNRRYAAFLHPHQAMVRPGMRYDDLLRCLVASGAVVDAGDDEEGWVRRRLARFRAGGEMRDVLRNGRWIHIQERRLDDGSLVQVALDISERKRAEDELRASEERFRNLIEGSLQGIFIHRDGALLFANLAFAQMLGYADVAALLAVGDAFALFAPRRAGERRVEVLLRMRDNAGRDVMPGAFIPAAERYGQMAAVDRWVIDAVLSRFDALFPDAPQTCVAVNLSGTSLADETLLGFVRERLDRSSLPPRQLCFEITETAAISHLNQALRFIDALKKRGCRFALDDFGSGLSSFAYLKRLPVDYLKIDGAFVRNVVGDPGDRVVVESAVRVARVTGIETIAEFVEDDATVAALREIGVDYVQGYGIGRPAPLPGQSSGVS